MAFTSEAALAQLTLSTRVVNNDSTHCKDPWKVTQVVTAVGKPIFNSGPRWTFDVEPDSGAPTRAAILRLSLSATTELTKLKEGALILVVQYADSATESLTVTLSPT